MNALNKSLAFGLIMFLLGGSIVLWGQCPVYNENSQQTYQSIQAAINAASSGDTIRICAGTFYENIVINKALTLQGYHMFSTLIQGDCTTDVVTITAAGVTIKDLGIGGCGDTGSIYCGLQIDSDGNIIEDSLIAESYRNVQIDGDENIIRDSWISTTYDYSEGIAILGNGNQIYSNLIFRANSSPKEGLGIQILSYGNRIYDNSIQHYEYAIISYTAQNNDISSNLIQYNDYGLYLEGSSSNYIIANNISNNDWGVYLYAGSNSNTIHRNNFAHTGTYQAYAYIDNTSTTCSNNNWNHTSIGNYWSGVSCTDSDSNGICDSAYTIPSSNMANDQDAYPLAQAWVTVCGNVNGDLAGTIDSDDVDYLICTVYLNCQDPQPPVPWCSGDVNGDGVINLSDITALINHVYNSYPAPSGCRCN